MQCVRGSFNQPAKKIKRPARFGTKRTPSSNVTCRWCCGVNAIHLRVDGWMDQAYSRLSTTHGHITDCKLDSVVYATCEWNMLPTASPIVEVTSKDRASLLPKSQVGLIFFAGWLRKPSNTGRIVLWLNLRENFKLAILLKFWLSNF